MTDQPLNFNPGDLGAFDSAPAPADELAAFDAATGATHVPAGKYLCRLEAGELTTTRAGKPAYRLRFIVVEPTEYAGFALWRYHTFGDAACVNRAKAALAPLGISTSADLRRIPFPESGRTIICRVVVGVQQRPDGTTGNDVIRFTVERDERAANDTAARFALPPDAGEGGAP
jgi:hypothetical protein